MDSRSMRTCGGCRGGEPYRLDRPGVTKKTKNPQSTHNRHLIGGLLSTYLLSSKSCHATDRTLRAMPVFDMSTGRETVYTVDGLGALLTKKDSPGPRPNSGLPGKPAPIGISPS